MDAAVGVDGEVAAPGGAEVVARPDATPPGGEVVDDEADLFGDGDQLVDGGEQRRRRRARGRRRVASSGRPPRWCGRMRWSRRPRPAAARGRAAAGRRAPARTQDRVGHRVEARGLEVGDRGEDLGVVALAAQGVVDLARPVDADQRRSRPCPASASASAGFALTQLLKKKRAPAPSTPVTWAMSSVRSAPAAAGRRRGRRSCSRPAPTHWSIASFHRAVVSSPGAEARRGCSSAGRRGRSDA